MVSWEALLVSTVVTVVLVNGQTSQQAVVAIATVKDQGKVNKLSHHNRNPLICILLKSNSLDLAKKKTKDNLKYSSIPSALFNKANNKMLIRGHSNIT